jgi:hypothetical protein
VGTAARPGPRRAGVFAAVGGRRAGAARRDAGIRVGPAPLLPRGWAGAAGGKAAPHDSEERDAVGPGADSDSDDAACATLRARADPSTRYDAGTGRFLERAGPGRYQYLFDGRLGLGCSIVTVAALFATNGGLSASTPMRRYFCYMCPGRDGESRDGETSGKGSKPVQATLGYVNNSGQSGRCSQPSPNRQCASTEKASPTISIDYPDNSFPAGSIDQTFLNKADLRSKLDTTESRIGSKSNDSQYNENLIVSQSMNNIDQECMFAFLNFSAADIPTTFVKPVYAPDQQIFSEIIMQGDYSAASPSAEQSSQSRCNPFMLRFLSDGFARLCPRRPFPHDIHPAHPARLPPRQRQLHSGRRRRIAAARPLRPRPLPEL